MQVFATVTCSHVATTRNDNEEGLINTYICDKRPSTNKLKI